MNSVSVAAAAHTLLARVATNVGEGVDSMLDMLAHELAACVRIYGLDSRSGSYRPITDNELRAGYFNSAATILKLADGQAFSLMTVHRADFTAFVQRLEQLDAGGWNDNAANAA
jgi:hypothetical protein